MAYYYQAPPIPRGFIWRRAHSLTGLWLVLFLMEHLLTNSQAALLVGDDGSGFVRGVNFLKGLPYLPVIEVLLLGIPFLIHAVWGVHYLFTAETNSSATDGSRPSLRYPRNRAFTWQRITSWVLLVGIIAHVIHMRFIDYPASAKVGASQEYMVRIDADPGLYPLSQRLGFKLLNRDQIQATKAALPPFITASKKASGNELVQAQEVRQAYARVEALEKRPLQEGQIIAVSDQFGVAELLMVRDTFKSPTMILLYTGLVLAACFHAFNGLWTSMITWGITLTAESQRLMRLIAVSLMVLITCLGLAAIWGTYWINLRY